MEKTGSPFTTNELPLETNNRVLISDWPNNQLTMIIPWPGRNKKKKIIPCECWGWGLDTVPNGVDTSGTPSVNGAVKDVA